MSGLFLVEQKAINNNYCGENLVATFMDAVSTIPNLLQTVQQVLFQKATVITKRDRTRLR